MSPKPLTRRIRTAAGRITGRGSADRRLEKRLKALEAPLTELRRAARYEAAHVRAGRLDYEGAEIWMRLGSFREFQRLYSCRSEPWTVDWIEQWIRPGEVLYDLGANVGAYSLVAAKKPGGGARVYAFEPGFSTYAALIENLVLNAADRDITALPVAIGERTELTHLALSQLDAGAALHSMGGESEGAALLQPILVYALDDFVERFGLPIPAHIKLDVDGAEQAVLAGAGRVLSDPGLRTMLCELDRAEESDLIATFAGHGLHLRERFGREKKGSVEQPPAYGLFVREGVEK